MYLRHPEGLADAMAPAMDLLFGSRNVPDHHTLVTERVACLVLPNQYALEERSIPK